MKDVQVIIEPFGWVTLLAILGAIFLFGFICGFKKGVKYNEDDFKFEFENKTQTSVLSTTIPKGANDVINTGDVENNKH